MLDVRRFAVLSNVARTGSLTVTAAEMGVTQPAVGQQLRALESECGVTLVERVGRGVRLTAAGHHLLSRARPLLAAVADIEADIKALESGAAGSVSVSVWGGLIQELAGPAGAVVRQTNPGVTLTFHELHWGENPLEQLISGDCDVAVLPEMPFESELPVVTQPVLTTGVVAMRASPDLTEEAVTLEDLRHSTVGLSSHLLGLSWFDPFFDPGFRQKRAMVLDDAEQLFSLAANGIATVVLPTLFTGPSYGPVAEFRPASTVTYVVAVRKHFTPNASVRLFIDALMAVGSGGLDAPLAMPSPQHEAWGRVRPSVVVGETGFEGEADDIAHTAAPAEPLVDTPPAAGEPRSERARRRNAEPHSQVSTAQHVTERSVD